MFLLSHSSALKEKELFLFYGYGSKPLYLATLSHSWLVDLDSPMVGGVIGVNDPPKKTAVTACNLLAIFFGLEFRT